MKKLLLLSALAALIVTGQSSAQSSGFVFRARLSGLQEVPALSTPAKGELVARATSDRIVYRLTFSDLPTSTLFAHIHFGAMSTNGGVAVFLCGGSTKAACPANSGEFSGTIVPSDIIGPTNQGITSGEFAELVRAIRGGVAYANVHTVQYTGGEIRGQITTEDED